MFVVLGDVFVTCNDHNLTLVVIHNVLPMMLPRKLHKCHFIAYDEMKATQYIWRTCMRNTSSKLIKEDKTCKSCTKPSKVLSGGYCEHCLAVHVVKDWLKKDGVK